MKVVVIGCTHAGTAAIVNTVDNNPDAEVTVYERNDNISFLSCGIALYVGGVVEDKDGLFYSSPEALNKLGVTTHMEHEVTSVDIEGKSLQVKDLKTGQVRQDDFDKLIVTTGSWPIQPPIKGIEQENILLSKNYNHANTIIDHAKDVENIVVVGAGYIGVELVEAFNENGKNVTLIDAMPRIMSKYLDPAFTDQAQAAFEREGIQLALDQTVTEFKGQEGKVRSVVTDKGEYQAELVILCIGFQPNTHLFEGQLDMLDNGAIKIDEYMRTSVPYVYAAGDCCSVNYNPTQSKRYIPLATNAVRMGTLVGKNIKEARVKYMGTQGTSGIKIYEHNIASTGLTETVAKAEGLDVKTVMVTDNVRPEFMPSYEEATVKLVYDAKTRRLLGGQIISKADMTQSVNTLSVCIQNQMTVDELAFVDFFFQPHFNKPWNILNHAALNAK